MWHNVLGGFKNAWHSFFGIFGSIDVFLMILTTLGGMTAELYRQKGNLGWGQTSRLVTLRGIHKFFGWFIIVASQYGVGKGLYTDFYVFKKDLPTGKALVACNAAALIMIFIVLETRHRIIRKREDPFTKVTKTMTPAEFEEAIANGRKLVILDEVVVDIESFIDHHPGGKFVLQHNIGNDVGKFFYGGYALEGNLGPKPNPGYAHSNYARKIVNQLIVAQLSKPGQLTQETVCHCTRGLKHCEGVRFF